MIIYTPQPKKNVVTPHPAATAAQTAAPASAAPASGTEAAVAVVSGYLAALARGDRGTASTYLAGSSPNETFMSPSARVTSVHADPTGKGSYKAFADVQTSTGEYFITFTLSPGPGGLQINDHFAIKTGP